MLIHRIAAKLQEMIGTIDNGGVDKRGWRDARKTPFFTLLFSRLFGMLQKAEPDKWFFVPQNDRFPHKKETPQCDVSPINNDYPVKPPARSASPGSAPPCAVSPPAPGRCADCKPP